MLKLGVRPEFNTRLGELVVENGRVTGATVIGSSGDRLVTARKGVILATGGIARNAAYREWLMPHPTPKYSLASEANQGEGVAAATPGPASKRTSGRVDLTPVSDYATTTAVAGCFHTSRSIAPSLD